MCEGGMLVSFAEAKGLGPPPVGIMLCMSLHINRFPYLFLLSVVLFIFSLFLNFKIFELSLCLPGSGLPGGSDGKESACNAGDPGSIPGSRRSPGDGNGNPLQCSCLENPMDGVAWRATIHGVMKGRTQLSDLHITGFKLKKYDFKG